VSLLIALTLGGTSPACQASDLEYAGTVQLTTGKPRWQAGERTRRDWGGWLLGTRMGRGAAPQRRRRGGRQGQTCAAQSAREGPVSALAIFPARAAPRSREAATGISTSGYLTDRRRHTGS